MRLRIDLDPARRQPDNPSWGCTNAAHREWLHEESALAPGSGGAKGQGAARGGEKGGREATIAGRGARWREPTDVPDAPEATAISPLSLRSGRGRGEGPPPGNQRPPTPVRHSETPLLRHSSSAVTPPNHSPA